MQVIIQTAIAGNADPDNGMPRAFAFHRGQTIELPDALAAKWVASGIAKKSAPASIKAAAKPQK